MRTPTVRSSDPFTPSKKVYAALSDGDTFEYNIRVRSRTAVQTGETFNAKLASAVTTATG